jgi:hypothetical protein
MAIALADIEAVGRTIGGRVWRAPMLTMAVAIPLSSGKEEIAPLSISSTHSGA